MVSDPVVAWVEQSVKLLVDHPESVVVKVYEVASRTIIEVTTNSSETGKVIGRSGETAMALRKLLTAFSGREKRHYQFEVNDPSRERSAI
jgi:hypothetical protein